MKAITQAFQAHELPYDFVGEAARRIVRGHSWESLHTTEYIISGNLEQLPTVEGYHLQEEPAYLKGFSRASYTREDHLEWCYITLLPPGLPKEEALKKCLAERGFSIEAFVVSPQGERIDPFGVLDDVEQNILRFLKKPGYALNTSPRHLIGASRLIAECQVQYSDGHLQQIHELADRVLFCSRAFWFQELTMLLCGEYASQGLQALFDTRVLGLLLPEAHGMVDFAKSSLYHHKDLWKHTLQVVDQAERTPLVRWAALLHDAGKLWTRTYGPEKSVHFFRHDELGAILAEGICKRLRCRQDFEEALIFLIRHHQRPNTYDSDWSDSAVRRLMRECGVYLRSLLALSKADMTSKIPEKRERAAQRSAELERRITEISQKDRERQFLPKGLVTEVMKAFDLKPGPILKQLQEQLKRDIQEGKLEAHQQIAYYITYLQQHPGYLSN